MMTPSTASGRPTSDNKPQVALLERVGVVEVVRPDVGVELLEHLGGDVVVQRRGGIRQQQPGARGRGPHDHEELVVDVEQPENGTCTAQFAQLGFRGSQAGQRGGTHRRATPFAVLADDGNPEAVRRVGDPSQVPAVVPWALTLVPDQGI